MENIRFKIIAHRPDDGHIAWEEEEAGERWTYSFGCKVPSLEPTGSIVRRPSNSKGISDRRSFRDPSKGANADAVAEAQRFVRENDLIAVRQRELEEKAAERARRDALHNTFSNECQTGPQLAAVVRGLIECFGKDALRGIAAQCPALAQARELISEIEAGGRSFEAREIGGPGEPRWHPCWAINEQAAREHYAFKVGGRELLPDQVEAREAQA